MSKTHTNHMGNYPRTVKRMHLLGLAAGHIQDKHHLGEIRKLFIEGEKAQKAFRNNKRVIHVASDSDE